MTIIGLTTDQIYAQAHLQIMNFVTLAHSFGLAALEARDALPPHVVEFAAAILAETSAFAAAERNATWG